jgi:hypothetical protein
LTEGRFTQRKEEKMVRERAEKMPSWGVVVTRVDAAHQRREYLPVSRSKKPARGRRASGICLQVHTCVYVVEVVVMVRRK